MAKKLLHNTTDLNELPSKIKILLLKLIQNFDKKNCYEDEEDEDDEKKFFVNNLELSQDFYSLCKYFYGCDTTEFLSLIDSLETTFLTNTGYKDIVALNYHNHLLELELQILKNKQIDYFRFCNLLQSFNCYFHEFKGQYTIPSRLSQCLYTLQEIFDNNCYRYIDLKRKINRKIRLVLSEYSMHIGFDKHKDFNDSKYADKFDRRIIHSAYASNYQIFHNTLDDIDSQTAIDYIFGDNEDSI